MGRSFWDTIFGMVFLCLMLAIYILLLLRASIPRGPILDGHAETSPSNGSDMWQSHVHVPQAISCIIGASCLSDSHIFPSDFVGMPMEHLAIIPWRWDLMQHDPTNWWQTDGQMLQAFPGMLCRAWQGQGGQGQTGLAMAGFEVATLLSCGLNALGTPGGLQSVQSPLQDWKGSASTFSKQAPGGQVEGCGAGTSILFIFCMEYHPQLTDIQLRSCLWLDQAWVTLSLGNIGTYWEIM